MTAAALLERSTPRSAALRLLAHVMNTKPAWLLAHGDTPLSPKQSRRFTAFWQQHQEGIPEAYITGNAWFYGREFAVTPNVLIPRPESEHLIELVVRDLRRRRIVAPQVADIGTGSGVLALSIAGELSDARVDAVDISRRALDVAIANARRHSLDERCEFLWGDLTAPLRGRRYDAVVANLPYVPTAEVSGALACEPTPALDGGPDGLNVYRRLIAQVGALMKPGASLVFEAAPPTAAALRALCCAAFPQHRVEIVRDYGRRERCICVRSPSPGPETIFGE